MTLPVTFADLPTGLNAMSLFDTQFAAVTNGANMQAGTLPVSALSNLGTGVGAWLVDPGASALPGQVTGDWTPNLTFTGLAVDMVYFYQQGTYTKTGSTVDAWAYIALSAKGSSTGFALIDGLPFAVSNTTAVGLYSGDMGYFGNVTGITAAGCVGLADNTYIFPTILPGVLPGDILFWEDTNFTDDTEIVFHLRYETDA